MVERRRHKRIRTNVIADIYIYSYFSPKFLTKGVITDLSVGGVKVEASSLIDEEDLLITFFLKGDRKFYNLRGRIIRTTKDSLVFAYGIRFMEIKASDKLKIWLYALKNRN
jgi:c-di-GMP-binding flagellar brake protein YcgR